MHKTSIILLTLTCVITAVIIILIIVDVVRDHSSKNSHCTCCLIVYVFYDPITNKNAAQCLQQQMETFVTHHGDFSKMQILYNKYTKPPHVNHNALFEWQVSDCHTQHDAFIHLSMQEHADEADEFSWIFMQHDLVFTSTLQRSKLVTSTHRRACNMLHVLESLLHIDEESNVNTIPVIVQHSRTKIDVNKNMPSSLAAFKQRLLRNEPNIVLAERRFDIVKVDAVQTLEARRMMSITFERVVRSPVVPPLNPTACSVTCSSFVCLGICL